MRIRENKNNILFWNSITGIIYRFLTLILGIVFRRVFIMYMGQELSGLTGMYSNVVDLLKLSLAGIGFSALHKLYLCNAHNDNEQRNKICFFAQRFYCIVSGVILVLGVLFSVFIDQLIYNNIYSKEFLRIVFMAQVLANSIPMLFSFYQILGRSYEEQYINNIVCSIVDTISYALQITVIILTGNYYVYLVLVILRYTLASFIVSVIVRKKHPCSKYSGKFSFYGLLTLFSDLKDTIISQVSNFVFLATDSIIISKFFGLVWVNLYNNYMIIINAIITFFDEINSAVQSRIGNKIANEGDNHIFQYLRKNYFYQNILLSYTIVGLILFIDEFIHIWLGNDYLLSKEMVLLFCINFIIYELNMPLKSVAISIGEFELDKEAGIYGALANIVTSIVLAYTIGISGVIVGSIIGNVVMIVTRALTLSNKVIKKDKKVFTVTIMRCLIILGIQTAIAFWGLDFIQTENLVSRFFIKAGLCIIIPTVCNMVFFRDEQELKQLLLNVKNKIYRH